MPPGKRRPPAGKMPPPLLKSFPPPNKRLPLNAEVLPPCEQASPPPNQAFPPPQIVSLPTIKRVERHNKALEPANRAFQRPWEWPPLPVNHGVVAGILPAVAAASCRSAGGRTIRQPGWPPPRERADSRCVPIYWSAASRRAVGSLAMPRLRRSVALPEPRRSAFLCPISPRFGTTPGGDGFAVRRPKRGGSQTQHNNAS